MNIVKISDGLGNQMFQYAFARKLEMVTGKKVKLDIRFINNEDSTKRKEASCLSKKNSYRKYGLDNFKILLEEAEERDLKKWEYLINDAPLSHILYLLEKLNAWPWKYCDEDLTELKMDNLFPTYYKGYFFNLKYYDDIKSILQREFSVKDKIKLPSFLNDIIKNEVTISVHVRRGDFTKLNRDISHKDYYPKAIEYINTKVQNPSYLIFSDDIEWVKDNLDICGKRIYVSDLMFQDYEELTIMKHCKHNIIANSTFSYWAAYLNTNPDKIVVCPKRWKTNIIPKEWIKL